MKVTQTGHNLPVKSWAEHELDEKCSEQIANISALPFAFHHIGVMADAHGGFGMPIGGVLATLGAVVPNAVGNDIGCGMTALRTNVRAATLRARPPGIGPYDLPILQTVINQIKRDIPAGNGKRGEHKTPIELSENLLDDYYALDTSDMNVTEGFLGRQYGTLGGGNHFVEIDEDQNGDVWLLLHSGSRALGAAVATCYNKLARRLNERWYSQVSAKTELNFLPMDSPEGQRYLSWMWFAQEYAKGNREYMLQKAFLALYRHLNGEVRNPETFDTYHNYAAMENHFGKNVLVTRKGAVRAQKGDMVIIPGSMETGSYIARGLGNPESFNSSPHGAGRAMSRTAAKKQFIVDDMVKRMSDKGIVLATDSVKDVVDEAGPAYHDIETVIQAASDLVEPLYHLTPMAVLKGSDMR